MSGRDTRDYGASATAAEGGRHGLGVRIARSLRLEGADTAAIRTTLKAAAAAFEPPYTTDELKDFLRLAPDSASWNLADDAKVAVAVENLRVRDEARVVRERERSGDPFELPGVGRTLAVELSEPDVPLIHTVQGLHTEGFSTVILAQKKTGKTRLSMNLMRSLADDVPFLDYFDVKPNGRKILYMNYELMPALFKKWAREVGIENQEAVVPLHLQGRTCLPSGRRDVRPAFVEWLQANGACRPTGSSIRPSAPGGGT